MKAADLIKAQKSGERVAVSIPRDPRRPKNGRVIVPAVVEDVRGDGAYVVTEDTVVPFGGRSSTTLPGREARVRYADVVGSWAAHEFDNSWNEAILMDRRRDARIAYDLARKLHQERVARFAEAFRGLTLDQRALGVSTNMDDPLPVDLAEWLIESYDTPGTGHTVRAEAFEAISERIFALTTAALQGGLVAGDPEHAGWGIPEDWSPAVEAVAEPVWPAGAIACSEPICDLPSVEAGENLYRCERGHMTIAPTGKVA